MTDRNHGPGNEELSAQVALLSTRIARCIKSAENNRERASEAVRAAIDTLKSTDVTSAEYEERQYDHLLRQARCHEASRLFGNVCYALTDAHPADRHKALDKLQADAIRFIAHVVRTTLDAVGHTGERATDEELAKRVSDVLEKGFGIRLSIAEQLYMSTDSKEKTDD